jgi:hypothetical protein
MTLDASGRLGIGTASPSVALDVVGSAAVSGGLLVDTNTLEVDAANNRVAISRSGAFVGNERLHIGFDSAGAQSQAINFRDNNASASGSVYAVFRRSDDTYAGNIRRNVTDNALYIGGNSYLSLGSGDTERARITSGGYFKASNNGTYVNSTGAYHELTTTAGDWVSYFVNTSASSPLGINVVYTGATPNGTGNPFLQCSDGTARAVIRSNGGLANYQANNVDLSDVRTKTDITPLDSMWGKVAALEIVSYKYVDQTHDDVNLGVIAQQVETVEPVWVDSDGFGDTPEGEEPMKTVYNKDITFAAIKALQEAMARIESLEARLAALESH